MLMYVAPAGLSATQNNSYLDQMENPTNIHFFISPTIIGSLLPINLSLHVKRQNLSGMRPNYTLQEPHT